MVKLQAIAGLVSHAGTPSKAVSSEVSAGVGTTLATLVEDARGAIVGRELSGVDPSNLLHGPALVTSE
ncbi:MAG: hypothetical protein JWN41_58, partial [Thermoleophilia bacterium]|nr:hypothetical protein [Thermoleophilia bacterium]